MSKNKMLIDASQLGEVRVAMVRGNNVDEFDFESENKKRLRGNIYLAKVTRVEPSLQAAFIEYGGNRHGFLTFNEIHPDYYQIPVADRQALIDAEAEEAQKQREKDELEDDNHDEDNNDNENGNGGDDGDENGNDDGEDNGSDEDEGNRDNVTDSDESNDEGKDDNENDNNDEGDDEGGRTINADNENDDVVSEEVAPKRVRRQTSRPRKKDTSADDANADDTSDDDTSADNASTDTEEVKAEAEEEEKTKKTTKPRTKKRAKKAEAETQTESQDDGDSDANNDSDVSSVGDGEDVGEEGKPTKPKSVRGRQRRSPAKKNTRRKSKREREIEASEEEIDSIGGEDELDEIAPRKTRKHYKIQEVIKKRQILLVQVVKEERGNKGAALTTYLSLAGRCSVLMPNTARGGGISKKISQGNDRKRLKKIAQELDVPKGMGVIVRTAGAAQTKDEIQRDFEYLIRLWEKIRTLTLESTAPTIVYEEGSLIKRSIRDLFDKNTAEVVVDGDEGFEEAKEFVKMLMPENQKCVKQYKDKIPMFTKLGVEEQLQNMLQPQVTLKSGGYLVINQTEALVAIDVNSGRATRQHSVEETALLTNVEAAEEIARQLRLRDLSGLIVIDFIDMDERKNIRTVERKLKDSLKNDRARIQLGRISHFGLMEMSRQRIRASVLESISQICRHCGGTGNVRADSFIATSALRGAEQFLNGSNKNNINVRLNNNAAIYILNNKRSQVSDIENKFGVNVSVTPDDSLTEQLFVIEKIEENKNRNVNNSVQPDTINPNNKKNNQKTKPKPNKRNNRNNQNQENQEDTQNYPDMHSHQDSQDSQGDQDDKKGWWKKTFF